MSEPTAIGEILPQRSAPCRTEGVTQTTEGHRWNHAAFPGCPAGRPEHLCAFCGEWFSDWDGTPDSASWHTHRGGEIVTVCGRCVREGRHRQGNEAAGPLPLDVPDEYERATLRWWPKYVAEAAGDWPREPRLLFVVGNIGSGKTALCWTLAKEVARKRQPVIILDAATMRELWLADVRRRQTDLRARPVEETWLAVPCLILDSLHEGQATEGWSETLHRIVSQRLQHQRATVCTSAITGKALAAKYGSIGPSLRSRLLMFDQVELPDCDHRANAGKTWKRETSEGVRKGERGQR